MSANLPHLPIMVAEILTGLQVAERTGAVYIDGTLGAGGHSHAILSTRPDNRLLGTDRDPQALALAQARLAEFGERAILRHASYLEMATLAETYFGGQVDGILLDLGLSSMQLDDASRGFAFRHDAPLDMRFDPTSNDPTAADLVNGLDQTELANLIYEYGEEPNSRKIARAIIESRPVETTTQLAEIVARLHRGPREKIHPATQTFQALRIAVNHELEAVEAVLPMALDLLKAGGRLAVMTFHSLEDRMVKQYFKHEATDCICPPRHPICTCNHHASLQLINRKPLTATDAEIQQNPRARSAKLRIIEKL